MPSRKLTAREEAFCQNYIILNNGAQAAIKAGYSKNSAKEIAAENLTKPNIAERLEELRKPLREKIEVDKEYVIGGFKKVADLFVAQDKENHAMTATKALDNLAKHLGLYEKDNEQKKQSVNIFTGKTDKELEDIYNMTK